MIKQWFIFILLVFLLSLSCFPEVVTQFDGCYGGVIKDGNIYYIIISGNTYIANADIYQSMRLYAKYNAMVRYIKYDDGSLRVYEINGTCT